MKILKKFARLIFGEIKNIRVFIASRTISVSFQIHFLISNFKEFLIFLWKQKLPVELHMNGICVTSFKFDGELIKI